MKLAVVRSLVRPIITFIFAGTIAAGFLIGKVPENVFTPLASSVVTFWFVQRNSDKAGNN